VKGILLQEEEEEEEEEDARSGVFRFRRT